MSVYLIAQIDIHDPEGYKKYEEGARPLFAGYQCEVIVADKAAKVIEGAWPANKTVILRFEDEAEAMRWYNSPEYQAVAKLRLDSSQSTLVLARGLR